MKTPIAITTFLLLTASALAKWDVPHIEVTGTGVIYVDPEFLEWEVTVETLGPNVSKVAAAHTASVSEALSKVQELGVDKADIQTSRPNLSEHFVRRNNESMKDGYEASTEIYFTLRDIEKYQDVWLSLSSVPGVSIDDSSWSISDTQRIELRNKARLHAVSAAKEKAQELLGPLEMQVLAPLEIQEGQPNSYGGLSGNFIMNDSGSTEAQGGGYATGKIKVSATVTIVFQIEESKSNQSSHTTPAIAPR